RTRIPAPAPHARSRHALVEGRSRHVGERGLRVLPLQLAQGRPHPAASGHAAARRAVPSELDRTPDLLQSPHPGRPDGVPEIASAEASAFYRVNRRCTLRTFLYRIRERWL